MLDAFLALILALAMSRAPATVRSSALFPAIFASLLVISGAFMYFVLSGSLVALAVWAVGFIGPVL